MDKSATNGSSATSRFEYEPSVIRDGSGCVDELADELERQGLEKALVVCGSTVGTTPAVIDPVQQGLGDRCVHTFAETTPDKRLETASDAVSVMDDVEADVLVSLGGGSSLDVAKVTSVLAASDRSLEEARQELTESGTVGVPDGELTPIVAVPTTLAGADLSQVAGVTTKTDGDVVSGGVSDPRLMPAAVFYDPALVATTPQRILAGSAMNGFDKGLETLYAPNRTPVTDATAMRGLSLLQDGFQAIGDGEGDSSDCNSHPSNVPQLHRAVEGTLLVQYGISRPGETTLSIVHAFGHGLRDHGGVQQGLAHAIIVPHVLAYLFEHVEGRRDLLADALDVPQEGRSADDIATGVVEAVATVRDGLGLPTQLRAIDGLERADLPRVAQTTLEDRFMENAPDGLEPTVEELEGVLERAW